jgi:hypothetical protein
VLACYRPLAVSKLLIEVIELNYYCCQARLGLFVHNVTKTSVVSVNLNSWVSFGQFLFLRDCNYVL